MSALDDLLTRRGTTPPADEPLPAPPKLGLAVVACMDARMDVHKILGLEPGDAHVIRNAGGAVTEDVIRSLAISQRKLGTREVAIVQHTKCGMSTLTEDAFRAELQEATGMSPGWAVESFSDLDANVRQSVERVRRSPFLAHVDAVRGFVFDVETGDLREVA